MPRYVLTVSCRDRPGLVAELAASVAAAGGNIVEADQHTDVELGVFTQRLAFDHADLERLQADLDAAEARLGPAARLALWPQPRRGRLAVCVSTTGHCLYDLAGRCATGDLEADLAVVVSNLPDHAETAARFGVPFVEVPAPPTDAPTQARAMHDVAIADACESAGPVDLVVLARYMRVVGPAFIERFGTDHLINIHHSFLPAFAGARPYRQAWERGVKLVGATAHYVTADLDAGPIIAQDVTRVSHRDTTTDMARRGRDLEAATLARAVRLHLEHRVITYANRTVVFD